MKYGHAIRQVRTRRNISQKGLAKRIGMDASFLSMLESGKRKPSTETLESICKELQVPMHLLILLASEKKELRGISPAQASVLGEQLFVLLTAFEK